jgi:hypothetical protein
MSAPRKKKRGPCAAAFHVELPITYHALCFVQRPFGWVFWLIEQRKARLQDRIANTRSDQ